ncbi:unnamed protein product [Peniophora sp. CBMAI 1063]|nr:unnamed protein product [Peniophora sp. CBMAI 1063]
MDHHSAPRRQSSTIAHMDEDMMAQMGFGGFGKQSKKHELKADRFDKAKRTDAKNEASSTPPPTSMPPPPVPARSESALSDPASALGVEAEPEYDPDDDDDMGPQPGDDLPQFPITHELTLKDHNKVVSALALDPSGARVLSGSHDYDCKLWDFGGMDARGKPFKTWEPSGSYYIHDLKYAPDGHRFLVISGTTQPKMYDRDGEELATFIKGDMYIRDMKNTAGHVAELSSCAWHPREPNTFITGSADSTVRIWDTENKRKQKTVIVVKSKERGARTKVAAVAYSPDGSLIAAACVDGALHLWKTNSNFVRPDSTVEGGHARGTETGSICFSVDGSTLLSRGGPGDDTIKLWDVSKGKLVKKPIAVRANVVSLYPTTNAIFSPDNRFVVAGAGAEVKGGKGRLLFLRREDLAVEQELELEATPVVVQWHARINQLVVGLTNGQISVLYSAATSINGAKLLANKGPARKITIEDMSDALAAPTILTPHALPMFRDGEDGIARGTKRRREKERADPRKSRRPEMPVTGPGRGGRVGASATQHVVQNLVRDTTRDEDPREALLKYAEQGERDPQWTAAWKQNQPKPVFAPAEEDEKEKE